MFTMYILFKMCYIWIGKYYGLAAQLVGSNSLTSDQICAPAVDVQSLNYWTAGESLKLFILEEMVHGQALPLMGSSFPDQGSNSGPWE